MGRRELKSICLCFLAFIVAISADAADIESLNIWPMPESVSYGNGTLYLSNDFELKTEGSNFNDSSSRILKNAFLRSIDVVRANHVVEANTSSVVPSLVLKGINVVVFSPSDELQYGIDESYKLDIPVEGNPIYARLEAQTVYGALHGLQTFTQLCRYDISSRGILVNQVPWTIVDQPRFSYRGLLIDTSRHFLPLPVIKKVIDSMAYAKLVRNTTLGSLIHALIDSAKQTSLDLRRWVDINFDAKENVLHWHIVDSQSFPLEIPSYPKLWDGAYSTSERYTFADAAEIVSYAKQRGINVLAEIDVPGHAQSWGAGYPSLWPSANCKEPLDVSNEFTFKLIDGILSDFSKIFKYKFVHLGGDEVNTSCWLLTPHVRLWLLKNGMTHSSAYQYFVLRTQQLALSHGYQIVNWEETFNNFGTKLYPKTVVHNWLGRDVAQRAVKAGFRCIVSNAFKWYLDHFDAPWQDFYSNEPLANITDPKQQALILGGEVSMWGERVDASNIEQAIWPRAAAAAERLWTPYDKLAKDPEQVKSRLSYFRCVLNQREVAAAPLSGLGRAAPEGPGSCYKQ